MSDSVSNNQREEDMERVRKHVIALGEHFESVQIFVTRHMPAELNGTVAVNVGSGNWHTRHGQIREWLVYEEERIRCAARSSDSDEP